MVVSDPDVVKQKFQDEYGTREGVRVFRAPGRVNLIGEHTDYNLGYVLPIAMEMACFTAVAPNDDRVLRFASANLPDSVEVPVADVLSRTRQDHWTDYPVGVAQQLVKMGVTLRGYDIAVHSTVPVGSGLSSSAAIEVSTALAMLYDQSIDKTELAQLARRAEREFVGVPVGIMDQYVSVFGEEGKAIRIDCRSLTYEAVALPHDVAILAVNSMVKHELGSSAYATRVKECHEAVEMIRRHFPEVESLRDVRSESLERVKSEMPDNVYRRARHVTTEDERVVAFTDAAATGDLHAMGRLFLASHRSMRDDYEVSAEEVDFLVDSAASFSGVYGARMTGGGFGGCTVNLISPERVDNFRQHITAAYQRRFNLTPDIYDCIPAQGAGEVISTGTPSQSR